MNKRILIVIAIVLLMLALSAFVTKPVHPRMGTQPRNAVDYILVYGSTPFPASDVPRLMAEGCETTIGSHDITAICPPDANIRVSLWASIEAVGGTSR